ncbi:MAG TPA: VWA domain-containing protein [Ohtaekwangia sp.]|nr:VWA domain-containing protein [Ohtaekwangia sp.]
MAWTREIGITEIVFVVAFLGFYILYLGRVIRVARLLNTSFANVFVKLVIRTLYFLLIIVALLGPSFGGSQKEVVAVGKDIVICVDLSRSMDAFDIQPTRLEKVKFEMKRIINAFSSDRVGLVIFSSEAFMQCPLTYDQNALNLFIDAMNSSLVPNTGTDFGPPLKLALKKLEDENDGPATRSKSKIIVLISDGEDFGETRNEALSEIRDRNIRLFTLGVGTREGGNISIGNSLKKDRSGNVVVTRLNDQALIELAQKTDGRYFEINESRNDVNRLINTISSIEGELRGSRLVDVTANKYFYFLLTAACLMLLDALINLRAIRI